MSKEIIDKFGPMLKSMEKNLIDSRNVLNSFFNGALDFQESQTPAINNIVEAIETKQNSTINQQQPIFDQIIETLQGTLRNEGQLVRNTGTNSIKSLKETINVNSESLYDVFSTINEKMSSQIQLTRTMVGLRQDEIENAAEQREQLLRQRKLQDVQGDGAGLSQSQSLLTNGANERNLQFNNVGLADGIGDFIASIVGAITGLSVFGIASAVIKGSFRVTVGAILGNFLEGAIEQSLNNLEFEEETSQTAANAIKDAVIAGSIGTIFGKKIGALFAGGSIISNVFELDGVTNKIGEQFENEFIQNQSGKIGTALGAGLALAVAKKGGLRSKLVGGIATALVLFGDNAKQWLEDQGMPEDWAGQTVTTTSTIANFATVGAMFGPQGAIIGAALGFVYSLGNIMRGWLNDRAQKEIKEYEEALAKAYEGEDPQDIADAMSQKTRAETAAAAVPGQEGSELEAQIRDNDEEYMGLIERGAAQEGEGEGIFSKELADLLALSFSDPDSPESKKSKDEVLFEQGLRLMKSDLSREMVKNGDLSKEDVRFMVDQTLDELYRSNPDLRTTNDIENEVIDRILSYYFANPARYKMGSNGFQDFGRASLAILHGKEAVVPQSTPAGAFLSDYFTENWQPKSILAEKTVQLAQESAAISTSPRPVVVRGGDSLAAPVTNNNSQTTIVNNTVDPSRSLNHIPT